MSRLAELRRAFLSEIRYIYYFFSATISKSAMEMAASLLVFIARQLAKVSILCRSRAHFHPASTQALQDLYISGVCLCSRLRPELCCAADYRVYAGVLVVRMPTENREAISAFREALLVSFPILPRHSAAFHSYHSGCDVITPRSLEL